MGVGVPGSDGGPQTDTAREAVRVLIDNWHGHATVPARGLYPHQWSWDSAFIALGLQHWAVPRAAAELRSLFGAQWADGRIPHIAFNPAIDDDAYFPGPSFWQSDRVAGHPPIATSGIIQPPVHAVAVAAMYDGPMGVDVAFGEQTYPCLVAQNHYLQERRTVGDLGLAAVAHPWETGMDNSPAWDTPLHQVPADLSLFDTYTRRDLVHAGVGERPTDADYARYIRLALAYRDHGYDDDWLRAAGEFVVVDPAFNALWAWSELALARIARVLGRDPAPHEAEASRITEALVTHLWSAADGIFLAWDQVGGQRLPERTVGGLIPLLLPGLPSSVARDLVATAQGASFGVGRPDVRGVPSFDLTDPGFDPQRYWRGPAWLNTTWLVAEGLAVQGRPELADGLRADIVGLVAQSGLREYFNPRTGSGHGTRDFSWSAALVLHVLASHADLSDPQSVGAV